MDIGPAPKRRIHRCRPGLGPFRFYARVKISGNLISATRDLKMKAFKKGMFGSTD
jgi:hypothetical protein